MSFPFGQMAGGVEAHQRSQRLLQPSLHLAHANVLRHSAVNSRADDLVQRVAPVGQHPLALNPGVRHRAGGRREDHRGEEAVVGSAEQRGMAKVHRAEVRRTARGEPADVEPEAASAAMRSDLEQGAGERVGALAGRWKDQAAALLEAEVALEGAQLAPGIRFSLCPSVPMQSVAPAATSASAGRMPSPRIALGEGTGADLRAAEERDLVRGEVHRVDGGEARRRGGRSSSRSSTGRRPYSARQASTSRGLLGDVHVDGAADGRGRRPRARSGGRRGRCVARRRR